MTKSTQIWQSKLGNTWFFFFHWSINETRINLSSGYAEQKVSDSLPLKLPNVLKLTHSIGQHIVSEFLN